MNLLREVAWLFLLAMLPAAFSVWLHPRQPEWSWSRPDVTQVDLAGIASWSAPVLWVDARTAVAFQEGHIPGAVSLNESEWEKQLPEFLLEWQPATRVVVYCNTEECDASRAVALRLKRELNLDEIYVLKGGWSSWEKSRR